MTSGGSSAPSKPRINASSVRTMDKHGGGVKAQFALTPICGARCRHCKTVRLVMSSPIEGPLSTHLRHSERLLRGGINTAVLRRCFRHRCARDGDLAA
jgi:hypothetical protein